MIMKITGIPAMNNEHTMTWRKTLSPHTRRTAHAVYVYDKERRVIKHERFHIEKSKAKS